MYSWWSFHVFLVEHFLTETLVCLFMIQLLRLICLGFQTHFYFPFSSLEKFHFLSLVSCSFQSFIQFKLSGRTRQGAGWARQGRRNRWKDFWWSAVFYAAAAAAGTLEHLAHLNKPACLTISDIWICFWLYLSIWHTWTFGTFKHLALLNIWQWTFGTFEAFGILQHLALLNIWHFALMNIALLHLDNITK